jgi:hypothetical protein
MNGVELYIANLRIIWIVRSVFVPQGLDNIVQVVMLPADKNVAPAIIAFDDIRNTILVVAIAGYVNGDS